MSDTLASLRPSQTPSRGAGVARPLTWMPPLRHAGDSLAWTDAVREAAPSREGGIFESYWDLLAHIEGLPFPYQDLAFKAFMGLYGSSLWPDEEEETVVYDPGVTFRQFMELAWSEVEPSQSYLANWHMDCISEHLEAITYGQINRVLFNEPPGHAKSLQISVLYPAWQWLVQPSWRMLCATHTLELALRDAIRCRNLIESDFYQATFNPPWSLHRAQKSKRYYTNTKTGSRYSVSVGASITGFRGHCLPAGIMVQTEAGPVEISRLVRSHSHLKVLSHNDATGELEWSRILATQEKYSTEIYEVTTRDGRRVRTTGDHRFRVQGRGYRCARDLHQGDELVALNRYHSLYDVPDFVHKARRRCSGMVPVYDIQVESNSNFFANGLLTHNCLIFDDLLDAKKAFSKRRREDTLLWMDQAAMNRLNDLKKGAVIAIGQRLHEKDPYGHLLEMGGFEHVMLPTRYERRRAFITKLTGLVDRFGQPYKYGTDPRQEEGELLFASLFPADVIASEEKRLGAGGFSGQHQQNPQVGDGALFKYEHFCPDDTGDNYYPYPHGLEIQHAILSIDNATKAASQNDFLAISLGLQCSDGYLYMVPLFLERRSLEPALKEIMLLWARLKLGGVGSDGVDYPRLGDKLRRARIEGGLAGEPVIQNARLLSAKASVVPTEDEMILSAAANIETNGTVISALQSQARRAVAALAPPSSVWTQEEWDIVRDAPPLILESYPNGGQGDIVERASTIAPYCHARNVRVCEIKGLRVAKAWLGQLVILPNGEHDDAVQSTVGLVKPFMEASVGTGGTGSSASGDDLVARMKRNRPTQAASLGAEVKSALDVERGVVIAQAIEAASSGGAVQCDLIHRDAVIEALKGEARDALTDGDKVKAITILMALKGMGD